MGLYTFFPIHGSTQMRVTSAAGVAFAQDLGCQLVVLARECSIKDIGKIQFQLQAQKIALPLEVFVHGALCVAYSGQCLMSEALGGDRQTGAEYAQRLMQAGARRFRLELLDEGTEAVERAITQYRQLLAGDISGSQLWRTLQVQSKLGVTRGPLDAR